MNVHDYITSLDPHTSPHLNPYIKFPWTHFSRLNHHSRNSSIWQTLPSQLWADSLISLILLGQPIFSHNFFHFFIFLLIKIVYRHLLFLFEETEYHLARWFCSISLQIQLKICTLDFQILNYLITNLLTNTSTQFYRMLFETVCMNEPDEQCDTKSDVFRWAPIFVLMVCIEQSMLISYKRSKGMLNISLVFNRVLCAQLRFNLHQVNCFDFSLHS